MLHDYYAGAVAEEVGKKRPAAVLVAESGLMGNGIIGSEDNPTKCHTLTQVGMPKLSSTI